MNTTRVLLLASLCLVATAGCSTASGPSPAPQPTHDSALAEREVLDGTVGYVNQWTAQHLSEELAAEHATGPIPDQAWQSALRRSADGAASVHLGCASAEVTVVKANEVDIRLRQCTYPGASTGTATLAAAEGCLILAAPKVSAEAFLRQQPADGAAPPTFVESAAGATPGTWHVGPCG